MSKARLNILVVPPSTGRVKQYSVPQWIVQAAIALSIAMVIGFLVSVGLAAYGLNRADDHSDQTAENAALRAALVNLNGDIKVLREQLARLEQAEKAVRTVFGFPEVDPAVRALGTGGSVVSDDAPRGESDRLALALESEVERLLRRCDFERQNYDAVLQNLMNRKVQLDHTPSIYPVNGYLSRGFGMKTDPFTGQTRMHSGLDLGAHHGTPIVAPAGGTVILREFQTQMGNTIGIDHGHGIETLYGHLSRFAVKVGDVIRRGDLIGYVGSSGYSTGPHLHYEVRVNGRAVDPMAYIYDRAPEVGAPLAAVQTRTP